MKNAIRITLFVIVALVLAGALVTAGLWIGQRYAGRTAPYQNNSVLPNGRNNDPRYGDGGYGPGMMNGGRGYNMGPGMMNGYGYGNDPSAASQTLDQAYQAAENYLATLYNPDLKIAEVMLFSNNAYVRVVEQSTGIGAFELLVDPDGQVVRPEPGPNMMWNLKYSVLNHGLMMGYPGSKPTAEAVSPEMAVSAAQALQDAQDYLDVNQPGTTTAASADPFYGYYTIDILRDGKTVGMLSVNGSSGEVFLHTWHGTFMEARDY